MKLLMLIRLLRLRKRSNTERFKGFKDESGMGTVEIVIIIAVLVGLALIFRDAILSFAQDIMSSLFANGQVTNDVDVNTIRNMGLG